ncbi:MAG: MTH938/NDUFAF3 family protein [Coxiellaceae bacterium]|nr:MTH938/NDUFAF3 family protein [Coxiellaceae bacterium]
MIISEDQNSATYQIHSISAGKIVVNGASYSNSLIISPNQFIPNWPPKNADMLTDDDLLKLLVCKPEIILLGTGEKSIVLSSKKLAVLLEKQFHVECMNTAAACRTYTILSSENRNVVAGLIL